MKPTKPASIIATLLLLISCISFAQETKIAIGPALGNDVAAYGKVFGINPKPKEVKNEWKGQKLPSEFFWFDEVPKLGKIKVRWTEKSPIVVYAAVRFPDKAINGWQKAFTQLGLPLDAQVLQQDPKYVKISVPAANGNVCEAWYYYKDPEQTTGLPMIEFIIKEPK